MGRPIIKLSSIVTDMHNGVTKTSKSSGYIAEIGSIEEKYELSKSDVTLLFKHPSLKDVVTKKAIPFIIEDDIKGAVVVTKETIPTVKITAKANVKKKFTGARTK